MRYSLFFTLALATTAIAAPAADSLGAPNNDKRDVTNTALVQRQDNPNLCPYDFYDTPLCCFYLPVLGPLRGKPPLSEPKSVSDFKKSCGVLRARCCNPRDGRFPACGREPRD